jgi:O-antigen/teichoic acid export membrane protein
VSESTSLRRLFGPDSARGRLLSTGLPLLLTSTSMVVIPLIARQYLDDSGYSAWALLMTVIIGAGLLDLGGTAYLQSLGFGRRPTMRQYSRGLALTTGGAAIVTALALMAGPLVTDTSAAAALEPHFVGLVLTCGLAASARNAVQLVMARLQVSLRFRLRAWVAGIHAVTQVVACWVALAVGAGLWSLGAGVLAGSVVALLVAHGRLIVHPESVPSNDAHTPIGRFATYRTTATLVAVISSQADRWVLALVATPAFLADYDLALRFAQLPVGVASALLIGVISETAAVKGNEARRRLVRRTTRQAGLLVVPLVVGDVLVFLTLGAAGLVPLSSQLLLVFFLASVWFGVNALAAPTGFASIGVAHPERELYYSVPALACTLSGWAVALALHEPWLVVISTFASVTSWSLWFVYYGTRRAQY